MLRYPRRTLTGAALLCGQRYPLNAAQLHFIKPKLLRLGLNTKIDDTPV